MSQENVEIVRASYNAWRDGNFEALVATLDPEVEFRTSGAFPDFAPVYRGHDGMRAFWDAMRAPWELFEISVERIVEGKDCAAVFVRFHARGRSSGLVTDLRQGQALWVAGGRVRKVSAYATFEEALAAVGLSE